MTASQPNRSSSGMFARRSELRSAEISTEFLAGPSLCLAEAAPVAPAYQTSSLAKTFAGLCLLVFAPRAHVFALFLLSGWMFLLCFWSAAPCFWAEQKQLMKEKLIDTLGS